MSNKTTVGKLVSPICEAMESVYERCPQFIHPSMPNCVLLTSKEWEDLKTYIRLFRGREEKLLTLAMGEVVPPEEDKKKPVMIKRIVGRKLYDVPYTPKG